MQNQQPSNRVVIGGNQPASQQDNSGSANASKIAADSIEYGKRSATSYREQDKEIWLIAQDVPRLNGPWPYVVMVFSVVLPGSGTMIAAIAGYTMSWSKTQLFLGLLQMLTAVYLIGWIWSIWWGWKILHKSLKPQTEEERLLHINQQRSDRMQPPVNQY